MSPGPRGRTLPLALLVVAVAVAGWNSWAAGSGQGELERHEDRALDALFSVRRQLGWGVPPLDSRLLLLKVDRDAAIEFGQPVAFWTGDWARLSDALVADGALAVGLDFAGDEPTRRASSEVRKLLEDGYAALQASLTNERLVLIENELGDKQQPAWPERVAAFAADGRNSCSALFPVDPDGVLRRLPLLDLKAGEGWWNHNLSVRLGEIAEGTELVRGPAGWSWKGQTLPVDQGCLRINYAGPPGTVPAESLAGALRDLHAGRSLRRYAGKILLLIPDTLADMHATPWSGSGSRHMLGGEVHAQALNTLLGGHTLRRVPQWAWSACLALAAGAAALASLALRPPLALAAIGGGSLLYAGLALLAFCRWGWIVPLYATGWALALGLLVGWLIRFFWIEERRSALQLLFGRMVSRQVAEAMQKSGPARRGAERRQITLLFSDINGFTPACERLPPEQVLRMLNSYFDDMVQLVEARNGYVKQFVGDEIMAVYGALDQRAGHPRDAVYTACDMLDRLAELQRLDPQGEHSFSRVKLGINTGEAVLGHVGSAERWEYAAVGDDVNLAARLENLAGKMDLDILVSDRTRRLVPDLPPGWSWRSVGVQRFKGKTAETEVWTLQREQPLRKDEA